MLSIDAHFAAENLTKLLEVLIQGLVSPLVLETLDEDIALRVCIAKHFLIIGQSSAGLAIDLEVSNVLAQLASVEDVIESTESIVEVLERWSLQDDFAIANQGFKMLVKIYEVGVLRQISKEDSLRTVSDLVA